MAIGDRTRTPLGHRDLNSPLSQGASPGAIRQDATRFAQKLHAKLQEGPLGKENFEHFSRHFAALYQQVTGGHLPASSAADLLKVLGSCTARTPLASLGQQAFGAREALSRGEAAPALVLPNAPRRPLPSAPGASSQPSAASATSLRRQTRVRPRASKEGVASAPTASHKAAELHTSSEPAGVAAAAQRDGTRRPARPTGGRPLPPARPVAAEGPGATGVATAAGARRPQAPAAAKRTVPMLDREVRATDSLQTNFISHLVGEGQVFVVGRDGKRYQVPAIRFLRVGDNAMVESKTLGSGSFGEFSVGLLSQKAGDPTLVAIKKARALGPITRDMVDEEFFRHDQVFLAFANEQLARESRLSRSGSSPVDAVRRQFRPPRVHGAYFDDQRQAGYLLNSIADGDVDAMAHALSRQRSDLRETVVRSTLAQAGTQLASMHESLGLLHLDFKPANVLFERHGQVTVTDFGLSKRRAVAAGERATVSGSMPTPEMFDELCPAGQSREAFAKMSDKTDAFCLALSGLDMLARNQNVRLASWRPNPAGYTFPLDMQAQIAFLKSLQAYLGQLGGAPGRRRLPRRADGSVDTDALPSLPDASLGRALSAVAREHPDLTEVLLAGLEADPRARASVTALAGGAASGLPPAGSRAAQRALAWQEEQGTEMALSQPRDALQRVARALPQPGTPN